MVNMCLAEIKIKVRDAFGHNQENNYPGYYERRKKSCQDNPGKMAVRPCRNNGCSVFFRRHLIIMFHIFISKTSELKEFKNILKLFQKKSTKIF